MTVPLTRRLWTLVSLSFVSLVPLLSGGLGSPDEGQEIFTTYSCLYQDGTTSPPKGEEFTRPRVYQKGVTDEKVYWVGDLTSSTRMSASEFKSADIDPADVSGVCEPVGTFIATCDPDLVERGVCLK